MDGYVLVVDDQSDVRQLILDVLDSMGVPGREAVNGVHALRVIQEKRPSAIVLDIMMPVMNGFTLLTHIQADRACRKVPIILLSGIADNTPQMQNLPGVVRVIRKGGVSVKELRDALTLALEDELAVKETV